MNSSRRYGTARWPAYSWLYIGRDDRGLRYLSLRFLRFWVDLYGWRNLGRCRAGQVRAARSLAAPVTPPQPAAPRPPMEAR